MCSLSHFSAFEQGLFIHLYIYIYIHAYIHTYSKQEKKMDGDQRRSFSLLRGDGLYFNRIISRKSSVGQSSRIYYRTAEGVPFKWEMQPGTSKNQPEEEEEEESTPFSFPLSPPPQLQNKLLPLPNPCLHQDQPKNRNKFFWFLKRIKISEHYEKLAHQSLSRNRCNCTAKQSSDQSLGDFICSSSSSTLSSSTNHGLSSSRSSSSSTSVKRESLDDTPFCCSPWNITAIMVRTIYIYSLITVVLQN